MDMSMWSALRSAAQVDGRRARFHPATLRRVLDFARPHRRTIVSFLALATVGAVIGVTIPVLAGQAVDAIVDETPSGTVIRLAYAIAVLAVVASGVGLLTRLQSSRL